MGIRSAKRLGAEIRQERRRRGLTQAQLAEMACLRQATISEVENGKQRSEVRVIFDILMALGLQFTMSERLADTGPEIEDIF